MTPKWAGKGYRARPVMNVTPLVDVVLVLLIIFMVVIPALQQGLAIEIPGITNPDRKTDSAGQVFTLSINSEGDVYFEEDQVPWDQLQSRLKAAATREPGKRVVLRGDKGAKYAQVRRLYRITQQVGFPGVSMKVNHRQDGDTPSAAN